MLAEGKPGDQTWTEGWCRLRYGAELLAEGFSRVLAKNLISQGGTHLGVGNILENKFGQVKKKICRWYKDTGNGVESSDLGGGDSRNGGENGLGGVEATSGVPIREEDEASRDGMEYQFGDILCCGMNWIGCL